MHTVKRYIQAFVKALRMTLTGNAIQPVETRYPNLTKWVREGLQLAENALHIADKNGMDETTRKQVILNIDRRDTSMDVILRTVKHNFSLEYPMLLEAIVEHNLTTLYAMNMNDEFRVSRLAEVDNLTQEVRTAVQQLSAHLQNVPPSTEP
jgi:hypothetical protein